MRTSPTAVRLIKRFEKLRTKAYKPHPNDVWTIGWGHTDGVQAGDRVTRAEAEQLLRDDIGWCEAAVNQYIKVPLLQCQFDALVSFVFNVGATNFRTSTLRRELNKKGYDKVDAQLARWVHSGGVKMRGLVIRRKAEADMFADFAPRFAFKGAMPQTVEVAKGKPVAQAVKESRTIKSGLGVAGVGGVELLNTFNEASSQAGAIASTLGGSFMDPGTLAPLLLLAVGGYIIYLKFSDVKNGRAY